MINHMIRVCVSCISLTPESPLPLLSIFTTPLPQHFLLTSQHFLLPSSIVLCSLKSGDVIIKGEFIL